MGVREGLWVYQHSQWLKIVQPACRVVKNELHGQKYNFTHVISTSSSYPHVIPARSFPVILFSVKYEDHVMVCKRIHVMATVPN